MVGARFATLSQANRIVEIVLGQISLRAQIHALILFGEQLPLLTK